MGSRNYYVEERADSFTKVLNQRVFVSMIVEIKILLFLIGLLPRNRPVEPERRLKVPTIKATQWDANA